MRRVQRKWPSRNSTGPSSQRSLQRGPTESCGCSNTWSMKMWVEPFFHLISYFCSQSGSLGGFVFGLTIAQSLCSLDPIICSTFIQACSHISVTVTSLFHSNQVIGLLNVFTSAPGYNDFQDLWVFFSILAHPLPLRQSQTTPLWCIVFIFNIADRTGNNGFLFLA